MPDSLCCSSSNGGKQGFLVLILSATRAFSHDRGFDIGLFEVCGTDLMGRSGHDLLRREQSRFDDTADFVVGDAELGSGFRHGEPLTAGGAGRLVTFDLVYAAQRTDTMAGPGSPFDGVADLIATVPERASDRFAWVLALDAAAVSRLLAACTGALIDATQGKYAEAERLRSVDRIARAANLDMRDHWESGVEFFSRISKKAMMAALNEACGASVAENCAKLGKQDLALACADRIPGRGWLPPALVTPNEPAPEPGEGADTANGLDEPSYDEAENDGVAYQLAAE
jgi:hypothetical protein